MKKETIYTLITSITLADDNTVHRVDQEKLDNGFQVDLKTNYRGEYQQARVDYGVTACEQECLEVPESDENIFIKGHGIHVGKELWQLPPNLKNQVMKKIAGIEVECY